MLQDGLEPSPLHPKVLDLMVSNVLGLVANQLAGATCHFASAGNTKVAPKVAPFLTS